MFCCNFLAAGPSVAIVDIAISYFGPPGPTFSSSVSKTAFFCYIATPRCGESLLDAVDFEVWTKANLPIKLHHVYNLLYLGRCCKDIRKRTGSKNCDGICCRIWRMLRPPHDCRHFLPPSARHYDGVSVLSLRPSKHILICCQTIYFCSFLWCRRGHHHRRSYHNQSRLAIHILRRNCADWSFDCPCHLHIARDCLQ